MSKMCDAELADCLSKAADLIETRGWGTRIFWKAEYVHYHDACNFSRYTRVRYDFCMVGAILEACPETEHNSGDIARVLGFSTIDDAYFWNDEQKSKEPVVDRLRQVAARLLSQT